MKPTDFAKMLEATRLTRAGRLREATAWLQRALGGDASSDHPASHAPPTRQLPPTVDAEIVVEPASAPRPTSSPAAATPFARMAALEAFDWTAKLPGLQGRTEHAADLAPDAGRYLGGSFSNAAGSRSYKLYIPSAHDGEPRPLIVMLHGCTQSADDFAAGTRMNFAAEKRGCFVVYPEQSQAANAARCWNWFSPSDQARDGGEPALIAGITRKIMAEHNIDQGRVYVAGLSAGGATAAIMGEVYPDLFTAVGVHSGLACDSAHDMASAFSAMRGRIVPQGADRGRTGTRPIPTIVFHGDQDSTVHPCNGAKVIKRANADTELQAATERKTAVSGDRYSHSVQYDAEGRSLLELWELHGAGHAWSGGSPAGSYTNPNGPDATEEMLRFFLEHRRSTD